MRLLHPETINILASHPEFPKTHLAHCWSEIFKWKASKQSHPKMFIHDDAYIGIYLRNLFDVASQNGCKLNKQSVENLPPGIKRSFDSKVEEADRYNLINKYFDDNYLFSDAVSLYLKGTNIFPDIFGNNWRKYVPVESLKEIKRQVDKTLTIKEIKNNRDK